MNKIFLFLLLGGGLFAAYTVTNKYNGLKKGPNSLSYKVIPGNVKNAATVQHGDMIAISIFQKMNDSVAVNSYENGHKEILLDTTNKMDFYFGNALTGLKIGDSIFVKISADTVMARQIENAKKTNPNFNQQEFLKMSPPFFTEKGNIITLGIKILDRFIMDSTKPEYKTDSVRFVTYRKKQEEIKNAFTVKQEESANKELAAKAKGNVAEGDKFLAENKVKEGVVTTASGLQYKVIKKGTGAMPTPDNTVVVNYIGTLLNGVEFDNSYKTNKPAEFQVKGVIAGWTEVLQLMPKGSKYTVWIPAKLAYGNQDQEKIPAGSLLVFDIELVDIK